MVAERHMTGLCSRELEPGLTLCDTLEQIKVREHCTYASSPFSPQWQLIHETRSSVYLASATSLVLSH
jgi:hypothetical protein